MLFPYFLLQLLSSCLFLVLGDRLELRGVGIGLLIGLGLPVFLLSQTWRKLGRHTEIPQPQPKKSNS